MRLDDQFRVLEPIGIVEYRPVDETLLTEEGEEATPPADDEDVTRYGMVKLTPLGLYGIRERMLEAGVEAPAVGDLADKGADVLLDGIAYYPEEAARTEVGLWLGRRGAEGARAAAAELLGAARGTDRRAPLRRLHCQQALALVGQEAEPEVRAVLDDPELGGLARVWLAERGAADVAGAARVDDLLARRGHDRRAAGRRRRAGRAPGAGRGARLPAQRLLRRGLAGGAPRHRRGPGGDGPASTATAAPRRPPVRPPTRRGRGRRTEAGTGRRRGMRAAAPAPVAGQAPEFRRPFTRRTVGHGSRLRASGSQ